MKADNIINKKTDKEMISVSLGELFEKEELKEIKKFIDKNNWNELREYLNSHPLKDRLYNKGVLADYIYYWFENLYRNKGVTK